MTKRRTKSEMVQAADTCRSYLLSDNNPHRAWDQYISYHLKNNLQLPYYIHSIKDFITASKVLDQDIQAIKKEKERSENQKENKKSDLELIKSLDIKIVMQAYRNAIGDKKLELCTLVNMLHAKDFTGITQSEIYTAKEYCQN